MSTTKLAEALRDAATSLETIALSAGYKFDSEGQENYLRHFDQVRGYAHSRATVARAALEAQAEAKPAPAVELNALAARKTRTLIAQGYKPVGYLMEKDGERNALTRGAAVAWLTDEELSLLLFQDGRTVAAPAAPAPEPFPQPRPQQTPCGECHIQPGEVCDICGATAAPAPVQQAEAVVAEARGYIREGATAWDRENLHDCIDKLAALAAAPAAPASADTKDAQRYRWLQSEHSRYDPVCHLSWKKNSDRNGSEWVNTASLDSAIDGAMAGARIEDAQKG